MSSKILRDENGISRGVGFARFALPEICAEIINKFNGHPLPEGLNLSIRFADTPDQKKLKSLTAERRQFKTHEYNTAAFGPGSPFAQSASPATAAIPSPVQTRFVTSGPYSSGPVPSPVYAPYGNAYPQSLPANSRVAGTNENSGASLQGNGTEAQVKLESPSVAAHAKRSSASAIKYSSTAESDEGQNALKTITNATSRSEMKFSPSKTATKTGSPSKTSPTKGGIKSTPSKTPRGKRV